MTQLTTDHSYEEIRAVVVDILLQRERVTYQPTQYRNLEMGVVEVFGRRGSPSQSNPQYGLRMTPNDTELVRDIFWDLFRQGFITLGLNDMNETWPHFRLSHFGQQTLGIQSPYRFHDTGSFINMVRDQALDISSDAVTYLEEAVAAFFAGCLLSCCVMLGVAAEIEFLRLCEVSAAGPHGKVFAGVLKETLIRRKIGKFQSALKPLIDNKGLPSEVTEDLETNFNSIQSILRIARNEAGHASAGQLNREQVYVFLQLYTPFARQLMRLRGVLGATESE